MAVYKMIRSSIHDADGYAKFAEAAAAALARHGGEVLFDNEDAATRVLLLRFPDTAASWAHHGDPEVRQALSATRGSFSRDIVALEDGS